MQSGGPAPDLASHNSHPGSTLLHPQISLTPGSDMAMGESELRQPPHQQQPVRPGQFWAGMLRIKYAPPAPHLPPGPDKELLMVAFHSRADAGGQERPPVLPPELVLNSERAGSEVLALFRRLKCRRGKVGGGGANLSVGTLDCGGCG